MIIRTRAVALTMLLLACAFGAQAQEYPSRVIKMVMPFPAGGPTDTIARLIADQLRQGLGQPVIVENKVGAGGNVGLGEAAKAPKDGYTLAIITATTSAINPNLYSNLPYDADKDFVPIAIFAKVAYALVTRSEIPANNLGELVALLKAKPGALNGAYASTASQVANDLLMKSANVNFLSVPYKGDAAVLSAMLGGQIDLYFTVSQQVGKLISAGKLKGIAVASERRAPVMPEVPTFAEAGMPGFFDLTAWFGLVTNSGVPDGIVQKLNLEINRIVATPKVSCEAGAIRIFPVTTSVQEAGDLVQKGSGPLGKGRSR